MTLPQAANRPGSPSPLDLEALLVRFDQAWQQGSPPRIEAFLAVVPNAPGSDQAARRAFLEELVLIDLEYRWRLAALGIVAPAGPIRERPRLEDYVAHYADLGGLPQLSPEPIVGEYRVRRRWGDHPGHAEFLARFPRQSGPLPKLLRQADTELAAEFAARDTPLVAAESRPAQALSGSTAGGIVSVAALVEVLRQGELLSTAQMEEVARQLAPRLTEPRAVARELLQRGWLTPYQVNQLFLGRAAELHLGPYLILERLGEGGTGQVFKARHRRMNRVVALKLLRKELLTDADLVQRFYREIRVLGQLGHPNIVRALDAGPTGSNHLLALEYVEGIDLARLVKQKGPLPVAQACDYIRQAAAGLQHAHERGLVHRDVKPHNLMVTGREPASRERERPEPPEAPAAHASGSLGIVKILDLGLARLRQPLDGETTSRLDEDLASSLTPVGAVMMGTLDYMAPEQALDFHRADIRADIYSLGATFFYLLTGQPPFPGGTLTQKLLKHQQAEAPAVEQIRRDVPPAVAAVVRKMLAKAPQDRYQTPAEAARALASFEPQRPSPLRAARLGRWVSRRGLAAGLLLAVAGCLGIWLLAPSSPTSRARDQWQHEAAVRQVAFSPDGAWVYSGSSDFKVNVTDRATGQRHKTLDLKQKLPNLTWWAFSTDGKTLGCGRRSDGIIKLWDLANDDDGLDLGAILPSWEFVAFAPECKAVLMLARTSRPSLKLMNLTTKRYSSVETGLKSIMAVAFSPDNPDAKLLAIAGEDKLIKVYGLVIAARQGNLMAERRTLKGHDAAVRALAFAPVPNSNILASAGVDQTIRLWDVSTGEPGRIMAPDEGGELEVVAFSPDGRTLASAGKDPMIRLWEVSTGKQRHAWKRPGGTVLSLAFSPSGTVLAAGSADGNVQLWEIPQ